MKTHPLSIVARTIGLISLLVLVLTLAYGSTLVKGIGHKLSKSGNCQIQGKLRQRSLQRLRFCRRPILWYDWGYG